MSVVTNPFSIGYREVKHIPELETFIVDDKWVLGRKVKGKYLEMMNGDVMLISSQIHTRNDLKNGIQ